MKHTSQQGNEQIELSLWLPLHVVVFPALNITCDFFIYNLGTFYDWSKSDLSTERPALPVSHQT
jgi:hypothetical protein